MGRQDLRYDYYDALDSLIPGGDDMKTTLDNPRKQKDTIDNGISPIDYDSKEIHLLAQYLKSSI